MVILPWGFILPKFMAQVPSRSPTSLRWVFIRIEGDGRCETEYGVRWGTIDGLLRQKDTLKDNEGCFGRI